jgi:tetratricopeptide (TPR) repeat protein
MRDIYPKLLILILLIALVTGCSDNKTEPPIGKSKARDFANVLYNRQLFEQSIQQYEHYLNSYDLDASEQANINYVIGDIYFERMRDYENALAYYLKIKYLFPESKLVTEANKKIVACLERLQRSEDAIQALEETTSLEPEKIRKKRPGAVVAKIGDREITQGDIDFELSQLPPYLRSQFNTTEKKLQFVQQYILTEILYDKAKREELDKETEIIEAAFQAKREIMVQHLLKKEIEQRIKIEPSDVELYYNANKEKYAEKDEDGNIKRQKSFEEVKQQVAQDLAMERQQEALEQMTAQLMRAESAEIYEDKLQ